MPRLQFTLRDMFLATTLIAVGVGGIIWLRNSFDNFSEVAKFPICFAVGVPSLAMIGAGLGTPFRKKLIGAIIALFAYAVLGTLLIERPSPKKLTIPAKPPQARNPNPYPLIPNPTAA